jgi:hypothetical protein
MLYYIDPLVPKRGLKLDLACKREFYGKYRCHFSVLKNDRVSNRFKPIALEKNRSIRFVNVRLWRS